MYEIKAMETVAPNIIYMKFKAPKIASTARPGQFVIVRVDEKGERIPMSLAGWDEKEGTIDIVFYVLGTSTAKLSTMSEGECVYMWDRVGKHISEDLMLRQNNELRYCPLAGTEFRHSGGTLAVETGSGQARWVPPTGLRSFLGVPSSEYQ